MHGFNLGHCLVKISGEADGSAILQFVIPAWRVLQKQQGCPPQLPVTRGLVWWLLCKDPYVEKNSKEWNATLHYAWPISKGSNITSFRMLYPLLGISHTALIHAVELAVVVWFPKAFKTTEARTEFYVKNIQSLKHLEMPLPHVLLDIYMKLVPCTPPDLNVSFPQTYTPGEGCALYKTEKEPCQCRVAASENNLKLLQWITLCF